MIKISVIIPTNRVGGLDVLFTGLEAQKFRDFELVLVDNIYKYRNETIRDRLNKYNFPVKHVEPINNPWPINSFCRSMNTGLVHAIGEIVLFSCDYTFLEPDCLQVHYDHHNAHGNTALLGPIQFTGLPTVSRIFPRGVYSPGAQEVEMDMEPFLAELQRKEHNIWGEEYSRDVEGGLFNGLMWSIFEEPIKSSHDLENLHKTKEEMRSGFRSGPTNIHFTCLKNDSFKLSTLLDANGLEEKLDGSHGWQDSELAERLHYRGTEFYACATHGRIRVIDPHVVLMPRTLLRPYISNQSVYFHSQSNRQGRTNDWNIKEKRRELGLS